MNATPTPLPNPLPQGERGYSAFSKNGIELFNKAPAGRQGVPLCRLCPSYISNFFFQTKSVWPIHNGVVTILMGKDMVNT